MQKILIIVLVLVAVSGCAATKTGNTKIDDTARYLLLELGESTKKQTYLAFGQPHYVLYPPSAAGTSVWIYIRNTQQMSGWTFVPYVNMLVGGSNVDTKTAEFIFDDSDVLSDITTSEEGGYVNMWVGLVDAAANDDKKDWQVSVKGEMEKYGLPYSEMISK